MTDGLRCVWETGPRRCYLAAGLARGERFFCAWHAWLVDERTASQDRTIFDRWLDEVREKHGTTAQTPSPWCEGRVTLWSAILGEKPLTVPENIGDTLNGVRASPEQHRAAVALVAAVAAGEVPGHAALEALHEEFERTNPRLRELRRESRAQGRLPGPLALSLRRAFDQVRAEAGIPVDPPAQDPPTGTDDL